MGANTLNIAFFSLILVTSMLLLLNTWRINSLASNGMYSPGLEPSEELDALSTTKDSQAHHLRPAAVAAAPAPASRSTSYGLSRLLSERDLDVFFQRVMSKDVLGHSDASFLMPYLQLIWRDYSWQARSTGQKVGGFVDVGANVGAVTEEILSSFSHHPHKVYLHALSAKEPVLSDPGHPLYDTQKLPWALAVEASPATLQLLERRAEFGLWSQSRVKVIGKAAANASGTLRFCYGVAGSEQSGLNAGGGDNKCDNVPVVRLDELVDSEIGRDAQIFLLKVDAEGFDGSVIAGAHGLLKAQRVRYLVFENNGLWKTVPGVPVSVSDVVTDLHSLGYPCYYISPYGLIPFPARGTPEGERQYEEPCSRGTGKCPRHTLYNAHFWSNLLCALGGDSEPWFTWMQEATMRPLSTREGLLAI